VLRVGIAQDATDNDKEEEQQTGTHLPDIPVATRMPTVPVSTAWTAVPPSTMATKRSNGDQPNPLCNSTSCHDGTADSCIDINNSFIDSTHHNIG
jgi:hypothetical protein